MPVRHGPTLQLQRDGPARPYPQLRVPSFPNPEVPVERQRIGPNQPRPDDTGHLRQELLHEPRGEPRPPRLRSDPQVRARGTGRHRTHRRPVCEEPGCLLQELCAVHDQDGEHPARDRPLHGRNPLQLQEG